MATFATIAETASTNDDDYVLVSQDGVDYKQTRAALVASVSNARWLSTQGYTLGSEVIGSDDRKYYALSGSYNQDPTLDDGTNWQYIDRNPQVENFFKFNQNWNIVGKEGNPVPSTSSRNYASGEEIASGILADGAVTITKSSLGLITGAGSYYREYEGVDVTEGLAGVKLATGVISTTGVAVTLTSEGNTRVTVNLAQAGSHKFVGLSEGTGTWPDISDSESNILVSSLDVRGSAVVEENLDVTDTITVDTLEVAATLSANVAYVNNDIGNIIIRPTATIPLGYLECNGSTVSRTTYSKLYSVLGTLYGEGDGSTTFTLPDLRGEFVRGYDNGRGVDNGRALGSWQEDEFKSHNHPIPSSYSASGDNGSRTMSDDDADGRTRTNYTSSTGGSETRPRNIAMLYCIKYI